MEHPTFDYSKLKGRITEKCGTQKNFVKLMGTSPTTLVSKLACRSYFNQKEIIKAALVLDIEPVDVPVYFFTIKVQ